MAKQHTLATKQETNDGAIPVVSPMNMGKGLGWNTELNQYEVNVGQGNGVVLNADGTVGLQLSPDEGNQIQLRPNGIYLGSTAEEHLANLYVANHGNDGNAGTRDAPLRTIQKALEMTKQDTALYHIHLHAGHEFDWVDYWNITAKYVFRVYGAEGNFPDSIPENAYYRGYIAKDFPRAIINVRTREWNGLTKRMHAHIGETEIRGIHFKIYDKAIYDDPNRSGDFSGVITTNNGAATLLGCIIELCSGATKTGNGPGAYRADALFRVKTLSLINCEIPVPLDKFYKDGSANLFSPLVYGLYGPAVFTTVWHHNTLDGVGVKPNYVALGGTFAKVRENVNIETLATEIAWDKQAKTIFGASTNWDIFANT